MRRQGLVLLHAFKHLCHQEQISPHLGHLVLHFQPLELGTAVSPFPVYCLLCPGFPSHPDLSGPFQPRLLHDSMIHSCLFCIHRRLLCRLTGWSHLHRCEQCGVQCVPAEHRGGCGVLSAPIPAPCELLFLSPSAAFCTPGKIPEEMNGRAASAQNQTSISPPPDMVCFLPASIK